MRTHAGRLAVSAVLASAVCFGQGIITTVAGSYSGSNTADGGLAVNTLLQGADGIVFDKAGNFYIWEPQSGKVKKVNPAGIISNFAGNGTFTYSGDGGQAVNAGLNASSGSFAGLAVDSAGNVYISDGGDHVIRKVDKNGIITTVAGTPNVSGNGGDKGPATKAQLNYPGAIAIDSHDNLYIADENDNRIRRVDASTGIIDTVAGDGNVVYEGDNVPATSTSVHGPSGLALDSQGNLYIAEGADSRIRKVDTNGIITTYAGQTKKTRGFSGDGGPATAAELKSPVGLVADSAGNLFIADSQNNRIRKVDSKGIITTYAGIDGTASTPIGDNGPATSAYLGLPKGLALDAAGNLYLTDGVGSGWHVRKIAAGNSGFVCTNTVAPVITSVDSASAYGGYSYFTSGSWLEIKGSNLADPNDPRLTAATNPGQWTAADFNGVNAPPLLDGVSASIDGRPAYVWYISPSQINVQAPNDNAIGNVNITVTNCNATSAPFSLEHRLTAPGLLAPSSFDIGGKQYMVATFASDGAYVLSTSAGATLGVNSRPAKPGDLIIAYGIGFGGVSPDIPPGVTVEQANTVSGPVAFSFGSTNANLAYSGLAGNFVGLYEFYINVPMGLADGDYRINVTQTGIPLPQTLYLTVHQ